jgi:hypothetical protein
LQRAVRYSRATDRANSNAGGNVAGDSPPAEANIPRSELSRYASSNGFGNPPAGPSGGPSRKSKCPAGVIVSSAIVLPIRVASSR